jgi:hypothetical protein
MARLLVALDEANRERRPVPVAVRRGARASHTTR